MVTRSGSSVRPWSARGGWRIGWSDGCCWSFFALPSCVIPPGKFQVNLFRLILNWGIELSVYDPCSFASLSVSPSVRPSVRPFVCSSVCPFIRPFIRLSVRPSVSLFYQPMLFYIELSLFVLFSLASYTRSSDACSHLWCQLWVILYTNTILINSHAICVCVRIWHKMFSSKNSYACSLYC